MNKIRVDGKVKVSSVRGDAKVWPPVGEDSEKSSSPSETSTPSSDESRRVHVPVVNHSRPKE